MAVFWQSKIKSEKQRHTYLLPPFGKKCKIFGLWYICRIKTAKRNSNKLVFTIKMKCFANSLATRRFFFFSEGGGGGVGGHWLLRFSFLSYIIGLGRLLSWYKCYFWVCFIAQKNQANFCAEAKLVFFFFNFFFDLAKFCCRCLTLPQLRWCFLY